MSKLFTYSFTNFNTDTSKGHEDQNKKRIGQ